MMEAHDGGLMGNFGIGKTMGILEKQFYFQRYTYMFPKFVSNVLNIELLKWDFFFKVFIPQSP